MKDFVEKTKTDLHPIEEKLPQTWFFFTTSSSASTVYLDWRHHRLTACYSIMVMILERRVCLRKVRENKFCFPLIFNNIILYCAYELKVSKQRPIKPLFSSYCNVFYILFNSSNKSWRFIPSKPRLVLKWPSIRLTTSVLVMWINLFVVFFMLMVEQTVRSIRKFILCDIDTPYHHTDKANGSCEKDEIITA